MEGKLIYSGSQSKKWPNTDACFVAPASYVAGLGRGASGFTTRSDIGPAREGPTSSEAAEALARGETIGNDRGRGAGAEDDEGGDESRYQDPENETGLFAGTPYDADDQEADNIYESVEKKMDERRRARREKREYEEAEKARKERPPIQEQFSDLKRGLSAVTDDEWATLPEVANLTGKRRKKMEDKFAGRSYVVPDSILVGARNANAYESSLDEKQMVREAATHIRSLFGYADVFWAIYSGWGPHHSCRRWHD